MISRVAKLIYAEFFYFFFSIFFTLVFLGSAYRITTIEQSELLYMSSKNIFLSFIYSLPFICLIVVPVAYLFAMFFTYNKLYSTGELLGIFTSKISGKRLSKLFFIPTAILVFLLFINAHLLRPKAELELFKILNLNTAQYIKSLKPNIVNNLKSNKFIFFTETNKQNEFYNVLFYQYHSEKNSLKAMSSKKMILFEPLTLLFQDGTDFQIKDGDFTYYQFSSFQMPLISNAEIKIRPQILPTKALLLLSLKSSSAQKEAVELFERILLPLAPLIFFLFIFPLSLCLDKRQFFVFLPYLVVCVLFFSIVLLSHSLGKKDILIAFVIYPSVIVFELACGIIFFIKRLKAH